MANPYWDILTALKTALSAVANIPTIDIRHNIDILDPGVDSLGLVVLARAPGGFEFVPEDSDSGTDIYDFPVDIAWATNQGRVVKTGLEAWLQLEWDIEQAIHTAGRDLSGVGSVNYVLHDQPFSQPPQNALRVRGWKFKFRRGNP